MLIGLLTLFQPSRFQELGDGEGRMKNSVYFCNLESALHRLNLSHTGSFPPEKQGHQLHSESQSKGFKRAFPHGTSLTK